MNGKKQNWFVDVLDRDNKKMFECNVDKVCKQTEFYTFNGMPDADKRILERYFANTIEKDYPQIYDKLVNREVEKLSRLEKGSLIKFVLHQSFRTSRFINNYNHVFSDYIKKMIKDSHSHNLPKITFSNGDEINFEGRTVDEVIKEEARNNQEKINIFHYYKALQLASFREDDYIFVHTVSEQDFLVTSDNPVHFFGDPYNTTTSIIMPLNSKQVLNVISKSKYPEGASNKIYRSQLSKRFSTMMANFNNTHHVTNCEKQAIGTRQHLEIATQFASSLTIDDIERMTTELEDINNNKQFN